jgi:hypothetical protein
MKRVLTMLKMMVAKIDILETMTPLEFLSFRERLESGSGFQSAQFRELEFALGHKRMGMATHYPEDYPPRTKLLKRFESPTVWDDQLPRGFIEADDRSPRIWHLGVEIEDVFHARHVLGIHRRNAPHLLLPRLQLHLGQPATPPCRPTGCRAR